MFWYCDFSWLSRVFVLVVWTFLLYLIPAFFFYDTLNFSKSHSIPPYSFHGIAPFFLFAYIIMRIMRIINNFILIKNRKVIIITLGIHCVHTWEPLKPTVLSCLGATTIYSACINIYWYCMSVSLKLYFMKDSILQIHFREVFFMFKKTRVRQIIELLQKKSKWPGNFRCPWRFPEFCCADQADFWWALQGMGWASHDEWRWIISFLLSW